jgi:RES domain-containing protein
VYASESLALAALETLAHADRRRFERDYVAFRIYLPEEDVLSLDDEALPQDWQARPVSPAARQLGDAWLREGTSLALSIPSVIVPLERNYILNPAHPGFARLVIAEPIVFSFDARLGPTHESAGSAVIRPCPSGRLPRSIATRLRRPPIGLS